LNSINAVIRTLGNKNAKNIPYDRIVEFSKKDSKSKGNIVDGGVTNMSVLEIVEAPKS